MTTLRLVAVFLALSACAELHQGSTTSGSDWQKTLFYARQNVDAGNYFAADHVLAEYVRTHPESREAREIAFWRAAYLVDPANPRGSLPDGIAALDGYLADSTGWYRPEAIVLRRTAAAAQGVAGLNRSGTAPVVVSISPPDTTKDTVVVVSKSRDEEIASLRKQLSESKDELAKLSAELDRIKKRLANPTK